MALKIPYDWLETTKSIQMLQVTGQIHYVYKLQSVT